MVAGMTVSQMVSLLSFVGVIGSCQQAPEKGPVPETPVVPVVANDPGRVAPGGSSVGTRETREGSLADRGQATADPESLGTFGEQANLGQRDPHAEDENPPPGQSKANPAKLPEPEPVAPAPEGGAAPASTDAKAAKEPAEQGAAKDAAKPATKDAQRSRSRVQ